MLFTRWFCYWNRRIINSVPVPTSSCRRAELHLEELETRMVLDGAGLLPSHMPITGSMAVQVAPVAMGFDAQGQHVNVSPSNFNSAVGIRGLSDGARVSPLTNAGDEIASVGDTTNIAVANPPFGGDFAQAQETTLVTVVGEVSAGARHGDVQTTALLIPVPPGNQLLSHLDAPSGGTFDGNSVGAFGNRLVDHSADPLGRVEGFPFFPFSRTMAARAVTDDLPTAVQKGIADPLGHLTTTESSDTDSDTNLDRATLSSPTTSLTLRQAGSDIQAIFANVNLFVRAGHNDAAASPQRADGPAADISVEAQTDRDQGRTLPESTTPPEMDLFTPEGAGVLLGSLPLGLTALARALRELQAEESSTIRAIPPYLRLFGLGAWIGSALAYVMARQRLKRTTDFDELNVLRRIALRNKDRQ